MIYPQWLKEGDLIGVTAVSDGATEELDIKRFKNASDKLGKSGYMTICTPNVYTADETGRSSSGQERAKQYENLVEDSRIKCIISAKGGNYLNEMLEYVDFEKICARPVWFQGYSDNTGLIHVLTTCYDMAAIYGNNFGDFGMDKWHASIWDNIDLLEGKKKIYEGYDKYQDNFVDRITGVEGYELTKQTKWYTADGMPANFKGRLIGGCLDVLLFLQGTKYDGTEQFISKYKDDGIIWYFESFSTDAENLMLFIWKLKEIGWFKYCKGVIFGRPMFFNSFSGISYQEAAMYALGSLDIPVVFECDFGHKPPRIPLINGALAGVSCVNGKGTIRYLE